MGRIRKVNLVFGKIHRGFDRILLIPVHVEKCMHKCAQTSRRLTALPSCQLTVKLKGRTETPYERRGRTLFFGARGVEPFTHTDLRTIVIPAHAHHSGDIGRRLHLSG